MSGPYGPQNLATAVGGRINGQTWCFMYIDTSYLPKFTHLYKYFDDPHN